MKNTTTEQKSIENTTTEQKSIEKTAMKKITATTLLLFLALFSLTTCLIAQESGQQAGQTGQQARKQGLVCGGESLFFHRNRNKNLKNNDNSGGYSWRSKL